MVFRCRWCFGLYVRESEDAHFDSPRNQTKSSSTEYYSAKSSSTEYYSAKPHFVSPRNQTNSSSTEYHSANAHFKCRWCFGVDVDQWRVAMQRNQTDSSSARKYYTADTHLDSEDAQNLSEEFNQRTTFPVLSHGQSNLREFTLKELETATKKFADRIGEGGFGSVYKGVIRSTESPFQELKVAVKVSKKGLPKHEQWEAEVNILGVVQHRNLIKLLGYCAVNDESGSQRLLVYEYMDNKSVEDHLSPNSKAPLPWDVRLRVAQDAAHGLAYLHEGVKVNGESIRTIFRDFKPSNVLLDAQWNAKLSDFGLVRLGPPEGRSHVSTMCVGTRGYMAPEYAETGHLTFKNDVWSYGMFLKELITGIGPNEPQNRPMSKPKRLKWVSCCFSESENLQPMIDQRLQNYSQRSAKKLLQLANKCMNNDPKSRPSMVEVLKELSAIPGVPSEAQPHWLCFSWTKFLRL